ncbi:phytoene/squalene synthetase [Arcticibacter pallidicorallinus]|uniref:Phytoene/squalene synthetase n=1 Tax=Arcticibacter pallidicorallinus TaxID=1259464 RepID=A0A2T0U9G8_9SPHI|nr:phytoene/squalene synthase family protein [Arcticibacter pallidicorallinus]PRY54559.1 phytoene/squalene synthetase [Arcticibacter pallidicorallinus]
MMDLYNYSCFECSKLITKTYSTSFSLGIRTFHKDLRNPIYAIYGFVRYADEIVDTFHEYDKVEMIRQFGLDTYQAIERGVSINPVLQSFQLVVNQYQIDKQLIQAFLHSMEMDLQKVAYTDELFKEYIYGSAEVVGLMCLKVFCHGQEGLYATLLPSARRLGSAFQKINFLRDIQADYEERGRVYFPDVDFLRFSEADKKLIEEDIRIDFDEGLAGIRKLPRKSRAGVYVAYLYYLELFYKIKSKSAGTLAAERIRVSDKRKIWLLGQALFKEKIIGL